MRTIVSACLMMFLFLSICPAGEKTEQNVRLAWKDTLCPAYETTATLGERVLAIGDKMVANGTLGIGSCGDFVEKVYNCAGYQGKLRTAIFGRTENEKGPYLEDMDMIQSGDWIMHINLDYDPSGRITHSAIFVRWKDKEQMKAMTLDYVGEKRCEAGHYSEHTLTKVYCIYRAIPGQGEAAK